MRRAGAITPAQLEGLLALRSCGASERTDASRWQTWRALSHPVRVALERDGLVERSIARGVTLTPRGVLACEVARAALRWRRARARVLDNPGWHARTAPRSSPNETT